MMFFTLYVFSLDLHSFPTRRSSDLASAAGCRSFDSSLARMRRSISDFAQPVFFTDGADWGAGFLKDQKLDRKSTRLNSSHLVMSYAVFCFKKKYSRLALRHFSTRRM